MSQVYTLEQLDEEVIKYVNQLKDPKISVKEKQDLRKKIHYLENHINSVNSKLIEQAKKKVEGKRYRHLYDPTPQTAEEKQALLNLINRD